MVKAGCNQRHRRIAGPYRHCLRVFLQVVLAVTKQPHLVTEVFLIHHLRTQLRVRRQITFSTNVKSVRRTLFVILNIRRVFPAGQSHVGVGTKAQIITPVLQPHTATGMVTGKVVIQECVSTHHGIVFRKMTDTHTKVGLGTVIRTVQTALREVQVFLCLMQRYQRIHRGVFQTEVVIRLNAHTVSPFQPLQAVSNPLIYRAGCRRCRQRPGRIAVRLTAQEPGSAGRTLSQPALSVLTRLSQRLAGCRQLILFTRSRLNRNIQLIPRLQIVKTVRKRAKHVQAAQFIHTEVIAFCHISHRLPFCQGVRTGLHTVHRRRTLTVNGKRAAWRLNLCSLNHHRGERPRQRQPGLHGQGHCRNHMRQALLPESHTTLLFIFSAIHTDKSDCKLSSAHPASSAGWR